MPTAAPGLIPPPPQPPPASAGRGTVVNPIAARIAAAMASPRPVFPKNLPALIYPPWLDAAAQAAPEACEIKTSERLSNSTHPAGAWFSRNALDFIRLFGAVPDTNIVGRVSPTPPPAHRSLGDPRLGPDHIYH